MKGLDRKLEIWQQAGLITSDQQAAIRAFEAQSPARSWALWGVAVIGVLAVGLGVISEVAANWSGIPDGLKLSAYFVLQAALGYAATVSLERSGLLREVFLSLFGLCFGAGIALVGQMYNLTGESWEAVGFWLLLALPAVLLAQTRFLPQSWYLGLTIAIVLWAMERPDGLVLGVAAAFLVLAVCQQRFLRLPDRFTDAGRMWTLAVLLFPVMTSVNLSWAADSRIFGEAPNHWSIALFVSGIAAASASLWRYSSGRRPAGLFFAGMLLVVLFSFLSTLLARHVEQHHEILGCSLFLAAWGLAAGAAATAGRKRLFDLATLVIAMRFLAVYFEVFGSLAATGGGLIVSGLVILGAAFLWNMGRKRAAELLGVK